MTALAGPRLLFRSVLRHHRLVGEMTKRDLSDRYSGQVLGSIWAVVHPVVVISTFMYIFGVLFRFAEQAKPGIHADHAVYLVSGLIAWLVASDVFGRSPALVTSQSALVKQVVFPIEVLPIKMVLATMPTLLIGITGVIAYAVLRFGYISVSYLLFPAAAIFLYAFLIGVALLLSAVGVFFRDLKDVVQLYTFIGLYLAPVFYPIGAVPAPIKVLLLLNPVTYFVVCFHDAAYFGGIRSPAMWIGAAVLAIITPLCGAAVFSRLKPYFGSFV
jgi:homopolymeric O-antigen transport system permease protein